MDEMRKELNQSALKCMPLGALPGVPKIGQWWPLYGMFTLTSYVPRNMQTYFQ